MEELDQEMSARWFGESKISNWDEDLIILSSKI